MVIEWTSVIVVLGLLKHRWLDWF